MSRDFALLPLDCPSCGAGLAAEADDVVFYCTACRSGYAYRPTVEPAAAAVGGEGAGVANGVLVPVPVTFLAAPTRPVAGRVPFWWLPARLEILERTASNALLSGLVGLLTGRERPAGALETGFAIPAHRLPLARAVELATRYTMEPRPWGELLGERLTGAVYGPGDAEKLAHYVLIASNVEQSDTLKDFAYRLDFAAPHLLGVPYVLDGGTRRDAFFGLPV